MYLMHLVQQLERGKYSISVSPIIVAGKALAWAPLYLQSTFPSQQVVL